MQSFDWQFDNGRTFALWPIKCVDARWAWLRMVYYADVNHGMFFNPYTVSRYYSLDAGPYSPPANGG